MKMNIEGMEFPVLLNAKNELLKKHIYIIIILYHCDLWKENDEEDLVSLLQKNGFSVRKEQFNSKRGWLVAKNMSL